MPNLCKEIFDIRSRKTFECLKTESGILGDAWAVDLWYAIVNDMDPNNLGRRT